MEVARHSHILPLPDAYKDQEYKGALLSFMNVTWFLVKEFSAKLADTAKGLGVGHYRSIVTLPFVE